MLSYRYKVPLLICCVALLLLVSSGTKVQPTSARAGHAEPASSTSTADFVPLPSSCGRGLPPGTIVPACCIFGYVFIDGQAVAGARVTITGPHGSVETWSGYSPDNTAPYYRTSLSDPPISAQAGDTITIAVAYSQHARIITHVVGNGAQQVDAVLPRTQADDLVFDHFISKQGERGKVIHPHDITIDALGYFYVTDAGNARIQVFNRDRQFLYAWGTRGDAHGEFSSNPTAVAVSRDGNVYVTDTSNHRIQQFTSNGMFVRSWGVYGSLNGQFNTPRWIAVDDDGYLYVTEMYNHRVQKFTSTGRFVKSWGGNGSNNGEFNTPEGIAADRNGNIYVADAYNYRIQKFDSNGRWLDSWGTAGTGDGEFDRPHDVEIDGQGNVYVSDSWNHRIQKFTSTGRHLTTWGREGSDHGQFEEPHGIGVDRDGRVYVADYGNNRIQTFTSAGGWLASWAEGQLGPDQFLYITGIAFDRDHNIYVVDTEAHRIQKYSSTGTWIATWGERGSGERQFLYPRGIALDHSDNIYVADTGNHRIQKLRSDGTFITAWGGQGSGPNEFSNPIGVAVDRNDTLYIADTSNHRIQQLTNSGLFLREWGTLGSGNGQFESPHGIAIDSAGFVYVDDKGNGRIQKFTSSGGYVTQWGQIGTADGQFQIPEGIAVDGSGHVYVADTFNNRIQKFTNTGTWLGTWGTEGGGRGQFDRPTAVLLDQGGTVFVSEGDTQRIQILRSMTYSRPIATIVAAQPRVATRGQEIALRGTGAVDPPNTIAAYEWLLDGSPLATSPTTTLQTGALRPGRHIVTFRVRDSADQLAAQSIGIDVVHATPPPRQSWTFLLYLAGDNDLTDAFSLTDPHGALYRLAHSPVNPNATVVALVDGDRAGDTVRYTFHVDGRILTDTMDEVNMGDPQTLIDFVRWGQRTAPADHFYLALADHANALDGIAWDRTSGLDEHLSNGELRQALSAITENGAHPLDLVHLDGCLMGLLETAYQLRGQAHYVVASENLVWSAFAYETYRALAGPRTDARALTTAVVDAYAQQIEQEDLPYTIAALDLEQIDTMARAIHALAHTLHDYVATNPANSARLVALRDRAQTLDANGDLMIVPADDYVDLQDWLALVQGEVADGAIRQAVGSAQQALARLVVHERHRSGAYRGHVMMFERAHGLGIYYPQRPSPRLYRDYIRGGLTFPVENWWDEFLRAGLREQTLDFVGPESRPVAPLPLTPFERVFLPFVRR